MPALVGPFLGFALGAALAWLCRAEALSEDVVAIRARAAVVALFAALVFAPACAYFLVFAGDWSLFYLTDSRGVPSALALILVVADAALVVLGFLAAHRAARARFAGADRALVALVAAPLGIAGAQVLAFLPSLRVDGTFSQVTSRFGTQPVVGSLLGWAILWMGALVAAGFVIAARILAERPRLSRLNAPPSAGQPFTEPSTEQKAAPQPLLGRRR